MNKTKSNSKRSSAEELMKSVDTTIEKIFDFLDSDNYRKWLTTMSHFHQYSLNNTILIALQKPDASLVAGYNTWQKQFGRKVRKGEKAIRILAPIPYKQRVETEKTDPNTGEILMNSDGTAQTEIQTIQRAAFKVVNVFDVSQTEGRELPTLGVNELTGEVRQYEQFFEALRQNCPVPISFEDIPGGSKGYYHLTEHRIALQEGMSQQQTIKTLIHEMAHQRMHQGAEQSRNSKEVEAESVAYTVCQHYGIDTSDYSFGYIAGWSEGKELPELRASLDMIRKEASQMITAIDQTLERISTREKPSVLGNLKEKQKIAEGVKNAKEERDNCQLMR